MRCKHVLRDQDRVGALALGHRHGDRRHETAWSPAFTIRTYSVGSSPPSATSATLRTNTGLPLATPTTTLRTSSAVRRNSPVSSTNSRLAESNWPGGQAPVGEPQRAGHLQGRQLVSRQLRRHRARSHFAPLAADQGHRGDVGHLLDGVVHLRRDAPQFEIAVAACSKTSAPGSARRQWSAASPAAAIAPGGIRSTLARSFWFSRTMLFSSSWPT